MKAARKPFRLLFVCMGNICRSPAAEIVFRELARRAGRDTEFGIDSAGTIGCHAGSPPDHRMAATLTRAGYLVSGSARQIRPEDLQSHDLVVTMDEENLRDVRRLDRSGATHPKIRPLTDFCQRHDDTFVPDPYHGGQAGFDHVLRLLEDGCQGILDAVRPA
jgi:protein-tyrosine phosphatase